MKGCGCRIYLLTKIVIPAKAGIHRSRLEFTPLDSSRMGGTGMTHHMESSSNFLCNRFNSGTQDDWRI